MLSGCEQKCTLQCESGLRGHLMGRQHACIVGEACIEKRSSNMSVVPVQGCLVR